MRSTYSMYNGRFSTDKFVNKEQQPISSASSKSLALSHKFWVFQFHNRREKILKISCTPPCNRQF